MRDFGFSAVAACGLILTALSSTSFAGPVGYETGKTIYKPNRAYDGYTICHIRALNEVSMIDMTGKIVHRWVHDENMFMGTTPLPLDSGNLLVRHPRSYIPKGELALVELDWDGNVVWEFYHPNYSLLHHDQRKLTNGNYLALTYRMRNEPTVAPFEVKDDIIFEVNSAGEVLWEWSTIDHIDQFGFDKSARAAMSDPETFPYNSKIGDLFHTNSIQSLPENKFFDQGNVKFRPGNILVSQRNTNTIFIIDRETGDIVWKMTGENSFTIAQHDANMIEKGLIGAGNILVYDNGGRGGYPPELYRAYTRILEINPVKRETTWKYDAEDSGAPRHSFFSEFTGLARRLPNGNTLINESSWGRIFEVDRQGRVVWEWMSQFIYTQPNGLLRRKIPRCYRVGLDWPTGAFNAI